MFVYKLKQLSSNVVIFRKKLKTAKKDAQKIDLYSAPLISKLLFGHFYLILQRRLALYLRSFAKKFCTEHYVSPFILYLPFCLLLAPMVLVLMEKALSK